MLLVKKEAVQEGINTIQLDITSLPAGHYYIRTYSASDAPQIKPFVKVSP